MKYVLLLLLRVYRKCISPLFPRCCRYYPTCSAYAVTAVERFGACKGSVLAALRLLRCHPWARGGVDEVPQEVSWRRINYFRMRREQELDTDRIENGGMPYDETGFTDNKE